MIAENQNHVPAERTQVNQIVATPEMARAFIAAYAEAKANKIPKIYAAGQREERDVIVALRSVFAMADAGGAA